MEHSPDEQGLVRFVASLGEHPGSFGCQIEKDPP